MLLLCLLVGLAVSSSLEIPVVSNISEVMVAGNLAEVTRRFELKDVPVGQHSLFIEVPMAADEQSITVKGMGMAEVIGTTIQRHTILRENDPDFVKIQESLQSLGTLLLAEQSAHSAARARVQGRVDNVKQYVLNALVPREGGGGGIGGGGGGAPPLEKVGEVLDLQDREIDAANARLRDIDAQLSETSALLGTLNAMLAALQRWGFYKNLFYSPEPSASASASAQKGALAALSREERQWAPSERSKTLLVHIDVKQPRTPIPPTSTSTSTSTSTPTVPALLFELSYFASPASWTAEYDMRLEMEGVGGAGIGGVGVGVVGGVDSAPRYVLRVSLHAAVTQSTAEDWTNVNLTLSTAPPAAYIRPPRPARRVVAYQNNQINRMKMNRGDMAGGGGKMGKARGAVMMMAAAPEAMDAGAFDDGGTQGLQEMEVSSAGVSSSGSLGSVLLSPSQRVNVTSNALHQEVRRGKEGLPPSVDPPVTHSTRVFIRDALLRPTVFSYIVPTQGGAHLRAWTAGGGVGGGAGKGGGNGGVGGGGKGQGQTGTGQGTGMGTGQGVLEVPLMDSQSARVFVEGAYRGTTSTYATPIGSAVRLDLGPDPLLSVTCTAVPSSGSEEEERGWFMSDKVKYSIQVVQYAITLVSAHPLPHLAVISDYLPHPSTDEIKVELLSPPAKGLTKFPDSPKTSKDSKVPISQSSQEVYGEEEFVSRVLAHPALQAPAEAGVFAFLAGGSHNLVFAKWVMPGESVTTLLKYRIVWPEGKQISQDNFQA